MKSDLAILNLRALAWTVAIGISTPTPALHAEIRFVDSGQRLGGTASSGDVATGDLDGDGDLDFVVPDLSGPNRLWLNAGRGTFSDSGQELGQRAVGVAVADLDGDSDLDILFLHDTAEGALRVWINIGLNSGAFTARTGPDAGGDLGSAVALGDLGGDARPDAFLARNIGRPDEIWLSVDPGSFARSAADLGNDSASDAALGDLDGDGDLDVFVANAGADRVWINQGGAQNGSFGTFLSNGQSLGGSLSLGVALGDLDGDGDLDAFAAESAPAHDRIWVNQGGRQGGSAGLFADSGQTLGPGTGQSRDVALGDFDRDGDLDALVARPGGNRIYENIGGMGGFNDLAGPGTGASEAVALGDLDGDGDLDVIIAKFAEPAEVWFNQSAGLLPTLPEYQISAFAGTGTAGWSGDGGPAIRAELNSPDALAVDPSGNVYIVEARERVRRVTPDGVITTFAGGKPDGFSGDGGPVGDAFFAGIRGIAADGAGNIYLSDIRNDRVRRVDANGIVSTLAGTGTRGFTGDGGPAVQATLSSPFRLAADRDGNVYVYDLGNFRIRRVSPDGIIQTIAGTGNPGGSGDGGPAVQAEIEGLQALAADSFGNLFMTDAFLNRIRKIDSAGVIGTIAGTGLSGLTGGGGPALLARLDSPGGIAADAAGNLFFTDDLRIRRIDTNGVVLTVAGGRSGSSGDGGLALEAGLSTLDGLAFLPNGDLLICTGNRVRRLSLTGNSVPLTRKLAAAPPPGALIDFGTRESDVPGSWVPQRITVRNNGTVDLTVQSVQLLGDIDAFSLVVQQDLTRPVTLPQAIPEGESREILTLEIHCRLPASQVATANATLQIHSNDPDLPIATYSLAAAVKEPPPSEESSFHRTIEEAILSLFLLGPGASRQAAASQPTARFLPALPTGRQSFTFALDPAMPHAVTSEVPSFLGGGSVTISNFAGRVTVTANPIVGDTNSYSLTVDKGTFTAPSFLLPSGVPTGPNTLTFHASGSQGLLDVATGAYRATASATIVNDIFPAGFPVAGAYSGTFDPSLGRASVRSQSTDFFQKTERITHVTGPGFFSILWSGPRRLEAATNVLGPWFLQPAATSPHGVNSQLKPQEYFRLRRNAP